VLLFAWMDLRSPVRLLARKGRPSLGDPSVFDTICGPGHAGDGAVSIKRTGAANPSFLLAPAPAYPGGKKWHVYC
jgi:hypothetical protein